MDELRRKVVTGGIYIMQAWLRTAVFALGFIVVFFILIVFLTIALKIALVLALLAVAYYYFTRAIFSRRSRRD